MAEEVIEIVPGMVYDHPGQRCYCQSRDFFGNPCPHVTTKVHLYWNSSLCDFHLDLDALYGNHWWNKIRS